MAHLFFLDKDSLRRWASNKQKKEKQTSLETNWFKSGELQTFQPHVHFFFFFLLLFPLNRFKWLRKFYLKFIESYVWKCVCLDLIRVEYHVATWERQSYIKITFFIISLSFHACLECQGCEGGAPRSGRLLRVWAGTGPRGLERFYQEKEDTTPAPNTGEETKHTLGTKSKWLCTQLNFHLSVIGINLQVEF